MERHELDVRSGDQSTGRNTERDLCNPLTGSPLEPTDSPNVWVDPSTGQRFAVSPINGATIPIGAHSGNTGGKPGRSGRKPKVFTEICNELLSDPAVHARLALIAILGSNEEVLRAVNTLARYVVSPPKQAVDVSQRVQVFVGDGVMGYRKCIGPSFLDKWAA